MVGAFITRIWTDFTNRINKLGAITKEQVVAWAKANFNQNYVVVYKRNGEDKNVQKVNKPEITPVEVNRDAQSPFLKSIMDIRTSSNQPALLIMLKILCKIKL